MFYLLYISNTRHSKLRVLQKHIPSKKIKYFLDYGGLHAI